MALTRLEKRLLFLGVSVVCAFAIAGAVGVVWISGLWPTGPSAEPQVTHTPLLYPHSEEPTITKLTALDEEGYLQSFKTSDSPTQVTDFYRTTLEADGWGGDSDTGGPMFVNLQWCSVRPIDCKKVWIFSLSTDERNGTTVVRILVELQPYR